MCWQFTFVILIRRKCACNFASTKFQIVCDTRPPSPGMSFMSGPGETAPCDDDADGHYTPRDDGTGWRFVHIQEDEDTERLIKASVLPSDAIHDCTFVPTGGMRTYDEILLVYRQLAREARSGGEVITPRTWHRMQWVQRAADTGNRACEECLASCQRCADCLGQCAHELARACSSYADMCSSCARRSARACCSGCGAAVLGAFHISRWHPRVCAFLWLCLATAVLGAMVAARASVLRSLALASVQEDAEILDDGALGALDDGTLDVGSGSSGSASGEPP